MASQIKAITLYETEDGERFESEEEAQKHVVRMSTKGSVAVWVNHFFLAEVGDGHVVAEEVKKSLVNYLLYHGKGLYEALSPLLSVNLTQALTTEEEDRHAFLSKPILTLGLPTRVASILVNQEGMKYAGDFMGLIREQVAQINGIGPYSILDIEKAVSPYQFGVSLAGWVRPELELTPALVKEVMNLAYEAIRKRQQSGDRNQEEFLRLKGLVYLVHVNLCRYLGFRKPWR